MAENIADFGIKIEANTKALDEISKKLDVITDKVENTDEKVEKSTDKTIGKFKTLAKHTAILGSQFLAVKKLFSGVLNFSTQAEDIGRMAKMANVSTDAIQDLGNALKNYGGSASSASSTLAKLNKQMADLRMGKGGAMAKVVMQYGLDTSAKSPEDMLLNISKRMQGMGALQQVNFGRALGLDDATIMLLQQGVEEVRKELEKAKDLRLFDKEDIENSYRLQRNWRELQAVLSQISGILLKALQPVVERVIDYLTIIAKKIREHPEYIKRIAVAIGGIMALLSPITALLTGIALIVDDIVTYFRGGESYTKDIVDNIKSVYQSFQDILNSDWSSFLDGLGSIKDGVNSLKEWAKQSEIVQGIWQGIKDFIGSIIGNIWKMIKALGGLAGAAGVLLSGGSFSDAWDAFNASFEEPAQIGVNTLKQADNFALNGVSSGTIRDSIQNNTQTQTVNIGTVEVKTQNNEPLAVSEDLNNWAQQFALGLNQ